MFLGMVPNNMVQTQRCASHVLPNHCFFPYPVFLLIEPSQFQQSEGSPISTSFLYLLPFWCPLAIMTTVPLYMAIFNLKGNVVVKIVLGSNRRDHDAFTVEGFVILRG